MCIIIAKEAGVKLPDRETLHTCWINNSDGAGFAYAYKGNVYIRKGFMTFDSLIDALGAVSVDLDEVPMLIHFRITTHGGTKPENCHPFPISDNVAMLTKPLTRCDVAVAHNGIIDIKPRQNISDTMEYVIRQLSHLKRANKKFYDNPHLMRMIEEAIESKMAFLTNDGKIKKIGAFVEHDGCMYSNASYMPRSYTLSSYTDIIQDAFDDGYYLLGYVYPSMCTLVYKGERYDDFYNMYVDEYGDIFKYDYETNMAYMVEGAYAIESESGKIFTAYNCDDDDLEFIQVGYLDEESVNNEEGDKNEMLRV